VFLVSLFFFLLFKLIWNLHFYVFFNAVYRIYYKAQSQKITLKDRTMSRILFDVTLIFLQFFYQVQHWNYENSFYKEKISYLRQIWCKTTIVSERTASSPPFTSVYNCILLNDNCFVYWCGRRDGFFDADNSAQWAFFIILCKISFLVVLPY